MSVGGPALNPPPLSHESDARLSQFLDGIQRLADELGDQPEALFNLLRQLRTFMDLLQRGAPSPDDDNHSLAA
jgi:ABC-type transporter Mla subunit MlaD